MSVLASGKGIGGTAGVRTDSITVPSGTKWLVVFPQWLGNTGRDITSVAWNSNALTKQGSSYLNGTTTGQAVFTLEDPTPATANLVSTLNQSTTGLNHYWACIDEVGAILDSDGAANTTITVDGDTGGLVLGMGLRRNASAVTLGGGATLLQEDYAGSPDGALSSLAGAASVTMSYTWTGGDAPLVSAISFAAEVLGPTITVQPANDVGIISNGDSTVYTATATGTNVQAPTWSVDATPISDGGIYDIVTTGAGTGECSSTLTITRTSKTGTPFDIKAAFTDDNGSTDTNTVTDTWWTGPEVTTFAPTDSNGESTATLTCDYVTGVGEAIEVAIVLPDGRVSVTTTTTA